MKISFLVTYFNQKNFVARSLESILSQDIDFPYEVLVGDDGSTDGTVDIINIYIKRFPNIISLYSMPRIDGIRYNPIYRASNNRLNLLGNSRGKYVCFLDGDDFYCTNTFASKAIKLLDSNPSLVGCAFGFKVTYPDGRCTHIDAGLKSGVIRSSEYVCNNYVPAAAIVFRNLFSSFDIENLRKSLAFDDNIITLYMLNHGDLYFIEEVAFTYYQRSDSIWNSSGKMERNIINAMDFDVLVKLVPSFRREVKVRQFSAVRELFIGREELRTSICSDILLKYLNQTKETSNKTVQTLLSWDAVGTLEKLNFLLFYLDMIITFYICRGKRKIFLLTLKYFSRIYR